MFLDTISKISFVLDDDEFVPVFQGTFQGLHTPEGALINDPHFTEAYKRDGREEFDRALFDAILHQEIRLVGNDKSIAPYKEVLASTGAYEAYKKTHLKLKNEYWTKIDPKEWSSLKDNRPDEYNFVLRQLCALVWTAHLYMVGAILISYGDIPIDDAIVPLANEGFVFQDYNKED